MEDAMAVNDFSLKFGQLNEQNQKYILAIQQALLYAQDSERAEKETKGKRKKRGGQKNGLQ